ncbi:unnamed protein product, partial [Mesorhabditis spiculigera]
MIWLLTDFEPDAFPRGVLSPHGECFGEFRSGYQRISSLVDQKPRLAAMQPLTRCLEACRINVSPLSRDHFPCQGINIISGRIPMCEFFPVEKNEKGFKERHWRKSDFSYYYEKMCFKLPDVCEGRAFIFDVRRDFRLKAIAIELSDVRTVGECRQRCLDESCPAATFESSTKTCRFYNQTRQESEGEEAPGVDYYENACRPERRRCENGRVDFIMAQHADVASFGIQAGTRSVRDCMRECNDENYDYYEVACDMGQQDDPRGRGSILVANERSLLNEHRHLQHVHIATWDECREACERVINHIFLKLTTFSAVFGCRTFAFSAAISECHLSAIQIEKADDQRLQINRDFDVFARMKLETESPRIQISLDVLSTTPLPKFIEQPAPASHLQKIFDTGKAIESSSSNESPATLDGGLQEDIFAFPTTTTDIFASSTFSKATDPDFPTLGTEATAETTPTSRDPVTAPDAPPRLLTPEPEAETSIQEHRPRIFQGHNFLQEKARIHRPSILDVEANTVMLPNEKLSENQVTTNFQLEVDPNSSDFQQPDEKPPPRRKPSALPSETPDPEELELEENGMPRVIPLTENVGHVSPSAVATRAECYENGVNVTFQVNGKGQDYTGAVYAAERFSQCRVFVKKARSYSIFIPRPAHNTWCNALEVDGVLSVVIVMSNDRVLPHDVTTKDDLFYQITCNYSLTKVNRVESGLVVGGPSPISIRSRHSRSFALRIMQGDAPVDSVFIGEKLVARVQSDIPPDRLRVNECTATRVGGQLNPATVQLIADGCALMPSIMGPMRLGNHGWEAPLNAFRIDGSEQIDIVCLVVVCQHDRCPEANLTCGAAPSRNSRSLITSNAGEPIRVDSRLKVYGSEREALREDGPEFFPELCIQPTVYLPSMLLCLFCVISLIFSLTLTNRHKATLLRGFGDSER